MVHRILRGKCLNEIQAYYESNFPYFHEIIFSMCDFFISHPGNDS